jgi:CelD/BcsL family acetyltransferase involved in cellulose biosynthesis
MSASYRLISADELDPSLVVAWRTIQAGDRAFESPYFCPEFTQAVSRVRDDVRVVVIENAGRPTGFFPHQRSHFGVGKPVGGPLSDYHGVIASCGSEWTLRELMRAARLSLWSFDHLAGADSRFDPYVTGHAVSPQADLSGGYEEYANGRRGASDQLVKVARSARKLAREVGEPRFVLHDSEPDILDQLIAWKRDQYIRSGLTDVFAAPWTRALLHEILHVQGADFAGACSTLRVGARVVAVHVGMRSRDVLHYWFPAYDPEFSKYSVGTILLLEMAKDLARTGIRAIDFGKGEEPYKQRAMTGMVELREGAVEMPSFATATRRARRDLETWLRRSPLAGIARVPGRWLKRLERRARFR